MPFLLVIRAECHIFYWVRNMLIVNVYFDLCNMDAMSSANALKVNDSLFRGRKVIYICVYLSSKDK